MRQGIPDYLIAYILMNLAPKILLGLLVVVIWNKIGPIYSDIEKGVAKYGSVPSSGDEPWELTYNSYLQQASTWNLQFKGASFLSIALAGLAVAWVRPFEVYWPVFLVILAFGTVAALRVNLPVVDRKTEVIAHSE